jgi:hypothetical protein
MNVTLAPTDDGESSRARGSPVGQRHLDHVGQRRDGRRTGRSLWRLAGAVCDKADHVETPEPTAEPTTASNRLTPQEIEELGRARTGWTRCARVAGGAEKQAEAE